MPPSDQTDITARGPYRALGVETDATEAQIKRAYHKLALRYHPVSSGATGKKTPAPCIHAHF